MLNQILEKLGKVGLTDWKGEGLAAFHYDAAGYVAVCRILFRDPDHGTE